MGDQPATPYLHHCDEHFCKRRKTRKQRYNNNHQSHVRSEGLSHRLLSGLSLGVVLRALGLGLAAVTVELRVVLGGAGNLTSELLEGLTLGLGNEKSGEDTTEHEESEDLEDVVEPRRGVGGGGATDTKGTDEDLSDDGTDLAGSSGETVGGGTVAGRETLARDDEGGGVGAWSAC